MKRFWLFGACLAAIFSSLFIIADHFGYMDPAYAESHLTLLHDSPHGKIIAASTIIGLLIADLLLPVPSSILMLLAGKFFGVWLGGIVSFTGTMGAATLGFYGCRWGGQRMFQRLVGDEDITAVDRWFRRYGMYAIIISRPVPMLTEVLSCLAGVSGIRARNFFLASILGHLPLSFLYGYLGSRPDILKNPLPAVIGILIIPAIGWLFVRRLKQSEKNQ